MMRKYLCIIILFIYVFLMGGCITAFDRAFEKKGTEFQKGIPTEGMSAKNLFSATPSNNRNPEIDAANSEPTPFPNPVNNQDFGEEVEVKCLPILPSNRIRENGNETIVTTIRDTLLVSPGHYLFNVRTEEKTALIMESEAPGRIAVSPDSKWLFYKGSKKGSGWVLQDEAGNKKMFANLPQDWLSPEWLDDTHLAFLTGQAGEYRTFYQPDVEVFNPFEGTTIRLVLEKGFLEENPYLLLDYIPNHLNSIYSPDLAYAVYPSTKSGEEFQLFGLSPFKKIMTFSGGYNYFLSVPKWTKDGKKFALTGGMPYEYYEITTKGSANRLTFFSELYEESEKGSVYKLPEHQYAWSPDGRYLAGSVRFDDEFENPLSEQLIVMDTLKKKVKIYCIPMRGVLNNPPAWSPDGNRVLVEDNGGHGRRQIYMIDLGEEQAYQFDQSFIYEGWFSVE